MSRATTHRFMLAGLSVAGLGVLALLYASPGGPPSPSPTAAASPRSPIAAASSTSNPAGELGPRALRGGRGIEPGSDTAELDAKRRRLDARRRPTEEPSLALDGPRPRPEVPVEQVQSNAEHELPPGLEAEQAERLGNALSRRADAVRERAEAARAEGDQAEAARQERILARLEARTEVLAQHAAAFHEEARNGLPDEPEPEPDPHGAHDHP